MSLAELDAFISEREKQAAMAAPQRVNSPVVRKRGSGQLGSLSGKYIRDPGKNSVWQSGFILMASF